MPKQKSRLGRLIRCRPTLFIGDVVRNAISRIGMAAVLLMVSMVIFAFLAGGVVVHRLETTPTASSEQQGEQAGENDQGESKPKHANHGQGHSKSSNQADDTEND